MRRLCTALLALVFFFTIAGGVANAEQQKVNGSGDITKMVVNNGLDSLNTKVFGIGVPCGGAAYLSLFVENRSGRISYHAQGVCTAGVDWHTTLYYTPTGNLNDEVEVTCGGFKFNRNATTGAYSIVMPRSCLDMAPDRVRVASEGLNYGSMGGTAGPTRLLNRG